MNKAKFCECAICWPIYALKLFFSSFCSKWNIDQVKKLVGINAIFITILRDPVDVFESGYVYFGMENVLERNINEYINTVRRHPRSELSIFGKNQLLYNLGKFKFLIMSEWSRLKTWIDHIYPALGMFWVQILNSSKN